MISVSGVAGSMVLENTSESGDQAQDVVDDTLQGTVNYLDVRSVVGVCDPEREEVLGLEMVVVLGPGCDDLNLTSLVIELLLPGTHSFLAYGDAGFSADRIISGGRSNSTAIIADGDIFLIKLDLPAALSHGQELKLSLTPAEGFVNFLTIDVPPVLNAQYVSLR